MKECKTNRPRIRPITFTEETDDRAVEGSLHGPNRIVGIAPYIIYYAQHTFRPFNRGWGHNKGDAVRMLYALDTKLGRYSPEPIAPMCAYTPRIISAGPDTGVLAIQTTEKTIPWKETKKRLIAALNKYI